MEHCVPFRVPPTERLLLELDGRGQGLRGVPLGVNLAMMRNVHEDIIL